MANQPPTVVALAVSDANRQVIAAMRQRLTAGEQVAGMYQVRASDQFA